VRFLELLIPPPAVLAIFAIAVWLASRYAPLVDIPFPAQRMVAVIAMVMGVLVALLGVVEFKRARTTINPMAPGATTTIVSSGVYKISRNPMYLGLALVALGIAIWNSALSGYLLVGVFCAYLTRFQIIPEERVLLERFGAEFGQYRSAVRRWI